MIAASNYLPPEDAREHIETNDVKIDELIYLIPKANHDSAHKKLVDKVKDKKHKWNANQLRLIMTCDNCGAKRCVFSKKAVDVKDGPTKDELNNLENVLENDGYVCGGEIKNFGKFFSKQSL